MRKRSLKILFGTFFSIGLLIAGRLVMANTLDAGLNELSGLALGQVDPRVMAANIVRVLLGFLGVVALLLIIYAGFLWMTSAGDSSQVDKAKKVLLGALIGLIIMLSAFAIATFVLDSLISASTGGSGGSGGGGGSGGNGVGSGSSIFRMTSSVPADGSNGEIRNLKFRMRFNHDVNPSSVNAGNFTVAGAASGLVAGDISVAGNKIEFVPSLGTCPANACNADRCLPANDNFTVTAFGGAGQIESTGGLELSCGMGFGSDCVVTFGTSDIIDCDNPVVNVNTGQVCANSVNTLGASATDDHNISNIKFFVNATEISDVPSLPVPMSPFNATALWDSSGFATGTNVNIKATAFDIDSHSGSKTIARQIRAWHCCDGVENGDEESIDCGGSCRACSGNTPIIDYISPEGGFCDLDVDRPCSVNSDCAAPAGPGGNCNVSVSNGAPGNFITIGGRYFGTSTGSVLIDGVPMRLASLVNPQCSGSWTSTKIIAELPLPPASYSVNPSIEVVAASGESDFSDDGDGALIPFQVNAIERPGLCLLSPTDGKMGALLDYHGIRLNSGTAFFGNIFNNVAGIGSSAASPLLLNASVPDITTGRTSTFVENSAGVASNYLDFTKLRDSSGGPYMVSFSPGSGSPGQYVTIYGSGFGNSKRSSSVFLSSPGADFNVDYNFPSVCSDSVWSDNQIVVKIGSTTSDGLYDINMLVDGWPSLVTSASITSSVQFRVDSNLPLRPSLCKINPVSGPNNSPITLWGEYFGSFHSVNSKVRFQLNRDQSGASIVSWGQDGDADKIETRVDNEAVSGPVKVVKGAPENIGNGLNFRIGNCNSASDPDSACGSKICCPAGSYSSGACVAGLDNCYSSLSASVYEWDFSTLLGGASSISFDACSVKNTAECTASSTVCCVDQMNGSACRSGDGEVFPSGSSDFGNCAYYECSNPPAPPACNSTNPISSSAGTIYTSTSTCEASCNPSTIFGMGQSCSYQATTTTCSENSCSSPFACLQANGSGAVPYVAPGGGPNSCGTCCCDPSTPVLSCAGIGSPELYCKADQGSCTGGSRGLCCGANRDSDCGPSTGSIGRGSDSCCTARPSAFSPEPSDMQDNVCRNPQIKVRFNQHMNVSSFTGNVILIGNYGEAACPEGTTYLAKERGEKTLAKNNNFINKIMNWLVGGAGAFYAPNSANSYCAISGQASGVNLASGESELSFSPSRLLDGDKEYTVIVKGDDDLTDEFPKGVLSMSGVGMSNAATQPSIIFNGVEYKNSYIFSFKTMSVLSENNGVCEISTISVSPRSYLFQTNVNDANENDVSYGDSSFDTVSDSDKVFRAEALDNSGNALSGISGVYDWNWSWTIGNTAVANFSAVPGMESFKQLVRVRNTVTEGKTFIRATASTTGSLSTGAAYSGYADAYLLVCKNPWPPVNQASGLWHPWRDASEGMSCLPGTGDCNNTNYEFYYCKDRGTFSYVDDLPALVSSSTVVRGRSFKCSDETASCGAGSSIGSSCGAGVCEEDVFKEAFFFREAVPKIDAITLKAAPIPAVGGSAALWWNSIDMTLYPGENLDGYIIYYGTSPGMYAWSKDIGAVAPSAPSPYEIVGLTDGVPYYFSIAARFVSGETSAYSNEITIIPGDSQAPSAPSGLTATSTNQAALVTWEKSVSSDVVGYKVYWKGGSQCGPAPPAPPGCYGSFFDVGDADGSNLSGLTNGLTYYVAVSAYDNADPPLESPYSGEISVTPYGVPAINNISLASSSAVRLSWQTVDNAVSYRVFYDTSSINPVSSPSVSGIAGITAVIDGLSSGTTYYFAVTAAYQSGYENVTDVSNEISYPFNP